MKVKLARVGVLLASVLSLLGVTMTPAEATQIGTVAFVGTATITGGGLGYPCTPVPGGTTIPDCLPGVNTTTKYPFPFTHVNVTVKTGNTRSFQFQSTVCLALKLTINKPGKGTQVNGPICQIAATGTVTGYCGLSSGTGSGGITATDTLTTAKTMTFTFKFFSVGGTLLIGGSYSGPDGKGGPLHAVVEAIPPNPIQGGGTCTDKSANQFTIVGLATLYDITLI